MEFGALDEAQPVWSAAAEAGDTEAAFNLGVLMVRRGALDEAANWWRKAADAGDADAAAGLGMLLVQRGELKESEALWRRAAEAGNSDALIDRINGITTKAEGAVRAAYETVGAAAAAIEQTSSVTATAAPLLAGYSEPLYLLEPAVRRLAETTTPKRSTPWPSSSTGYRAWSTRWTMT